MEKLKLTNLLAAGMIAAMAVIASCSENEQENPAGENDDTTKVGNNDTTKAVNNDTTKTYEVDPDDVSSRLLVPNSTVTQENAPAPSNAADLKIDKEIIYLVEGVKNRIRIKFPEEFAHGSSGILMQVKGSGQLHRIQPDEDETSDTVAVFYIGFDPGDEIDLPLSFDIDISPLDDDGIPIETIAKPVVVEEKGAAGCSPSDPHPYWLWLWSAIDGVVYSAPGMPMGTEATTNGCCLDGFSVDCIANAIPEEEWLQLHYAAYSMNNIEYMALQEDGSMAGGLTEQTQNLDYSESDFCSGIPSYIRRTNDHAFWGTFDFLPAQNEVVFTSIEVGSREIYLEELDMTVTEWDKCYLSPEYRYEILSCNYIVEISQVEGQVRERLFQRIENLEFGGEYAFWYD